MQNLIDRVSAKIRSYRAIVVVGAGMSWTSGVPLTHELWALLWSALDRDPDTRDQLAARLGLAPNTAKSLIGENHDIWDPAWSALASSRVARRAFQHAFARLDDERSRTPSAAHVVLAQLLHQQIVELVISFNWDTLLESAYKQLYGSQLYPDGQRFIKPHGDATLPDHDWILPHQSGVIPNGLISRIEELAAKYPRVLLLVGYSERDPFVVRRLTDPLAKKWWVVRISPSASGELSIPLTANEGLLAIKSVLSPDPEMPGWEWVKFDQQRGLGRALVGEGLGPGDVVGCPPLPEVREALHRLRESQFVEIVGESGTGKSITAYQVAFRHHKDGVEILRPTTRSELTDDMVNAVAGLTRPSLLVIDDAQNLPLYLVRRLFDQAGDSLKVLVASTIPVESSRPIRIAAKRAVRELTEALRSRREETLAAVRSLDKMVGDSYFDVSIERRLELAAQEDTPWLFTFVLTGGWQRAREQVNVLQDIDRADLLLLAIAAKQIASLDSTVSSDWVESSCRYLNRDLEWKDASLATLIRERAIISGKNGFRCPHVQYAVVTLRVAFQNRTDEFLSETMDMLRALLSSQNLPLQGIALLLNELRLTNSFVGPGRAFDTIVDKLCWERLLDRCWSSVGNEERRGAAFLLASLLSWYPHHVSELRRHATQIASWIETASAVSANGIGRLLNDVSQEPDGLEVGAGIVALTNPVKLSGSVNGLTWDEAASWGFLLDRLTYLATPTWRSELKANLDHDALKTLFQSVAVNDLWAMEALFDGLRSINEEFALRLLDHIAPILGNSLSRDPVEAWQSIHSIVLFGLRIYSPGLRIPAPTVEQRRIAKRITRTVDPASIARALSRSRRRDWRDFQELLIFLTNTDARKANEVIQLVDLVALDQTIGPTWKELPDELHRLLWGLFIAEGEESSRIRSWVEKHAELLTRLTPRLAVIAPSAVASALTNGGYLDLDVREGWGWNLAVMALAVIALETPASAINLLEQNTPQISEGLSKLRRGDSDNVRSFIQLIQELIPEKLPEILDQVSPEIAEQRWVELLRGTPTEREAAALLIDMTINTTFAVSEVSERLRQKFPKSSVPIIPLTTL